MYHIVRIDGKHLLSRIRVSVRPGNCFIREKHPKSTAKTECLTVEYAPVTVDRSIASTNVSDNSDHSSELGGCPFHGRVERDEIPTRESSPKQSGILPCPALPSPPLPSPPLNSPPLPSTPLPPLCRLLLSISMHTVCEVGQLN